MKRHQSADKLEQLIKDNLLDILFVDTQDDLLTVINFDIPALICLLETNFRKFHDDDIEVGIYKKHISLAAEFILPNRIAQQEKGKDGS